MPGAEVDRISAFKNRSINNDINALWTKRNLARLEKLTSFAINCHQNKWLFWPTFSLYWKKGDISFNGKG
jgi:hypothetical protein